MKTFWTILLTVIVVGVLAGGGTYYYVKNQSDKDKVTFQSQIDSLNNDIKNKTETLKLAQEQEAKYEGWQTFSNETLGISFKYPKEWQKIEMIKRKQYTPSDSGIAYEGNFKNFYFDVYTDDFNSFPIGNPSPIRVNLTWTKNDLVNNVVKADEVMGFSKGKNYLRAFLHNDYECSPGYSVKYYIPINKDPFNNLVISILPESDNFKAILESYTKAQQAKGEDICDSSGGYQEITDKILAGEMKDVTVQLETAQRIAESVKNI